MRPSRVTTPDGVVLPLGMTKMDLCGKRLLVPQTYFQESGSLFYVAHVKAWTTFEVNGVTMRGYSLFYPIDKKIGYMIESEAHDFYDPESEEVIVNESVLEFSIDEWNEIGEFEVLEEDGSWKDAKLLCKKENTDWYCLSYDDDTFEGLVEPGFSYIDNVLRDTDGDKISIRRSIDMETDDLFENWTKNLI